MVTFVILLAYFVYVSLYRISKLIFVQPILFRVAFPLIKAMITPGDVASVNYNKLEESVTIQITRFLTLPLRLATKAVECKIRYSKDNFSPP